MPDLELRIKTPADLAGFESAERQLERDIAKAKALGKEYKANEARLAELRVEIARYRETVEQAARADAVWKKNVADAKQALDTREQGLRAGTAAQLAQNVASNSSLEIEAASSASKKDLLGILKKLSHEIPGLSLVTAILKNAYIGVAIAITAAAKAAIDYLVKTREMVQAESELSEELRQSEEARRALRDLTREELQDAQELLDVLQQIIDKRREEADAAGAQRNAEKDLELAKIDEEVASGRLTAGEGKINKQIVEENFRRQDRAARIKGMAEEATMAEEHARKLRSVDLREAAAAVEDAKKKKRDKEDLLASGPSEKDVSEQAAKVKSTRASVDEWNSLSRVEQGWESAKRGMPLADLNQEMLKKEAELPGEEDLLRKMVENRKNREEDLKDAEKNLENKSGTYKQVQGLVGSAEKTALDRRSALDRENTTGRRLAQTQELTERTKLRADLLGGVTHALPGSEERDSAERDLKSFDDSIRSEIPRAPYRDPGRPRTATLEGQRLVRAERTVEASEGGLHRAEASGNAGAVAAWDRQLQAAREELARAQAAASGLAAAVVQSQQAQANAFNAATAQIKQSRTFE